MKSIFSIFKKSTNSFEGEDDDEKVVLLLRRHPFFILTKMSLYLLLGLVPIIAGLVFYPFFFSHNLLVVFFFVSGLWYLFVWLGIFYSLTMYTLDVWIVTDKRIIDSTQHGFFNRTISELHLNRVQDTSVEIKGIVQTFLKFGDLQVQTAGTEEKFKFLQVPKPNKVKDEIMRLADVSVYHHT